MSDPKGPAAWLGDMYRFGGYADVPIADVASSTIASEAQWRSKILNLTGTLTAGRTLVMPEKAGAEWLIINSTGQTVTVRGVSGAGASVAVTAGEVAYVLVKGADMRRTAGGGGSAGGNAYTTTTSGFTMPAVSGTVTVPVADSAWMVIGQVVFVQSAGYFWVTAKPSGTSVTLQNIGADANAAPAAAIATARAVAPAGEPGSSAGGVSSVVQKTGSYTIVAGDSTALLEALIAAPATFTLPGAAASAGLVFHIRNARGSSPYELVVSRAGTDTIDASGGGTSLSLRPGQSVALIASGTKWYPVHAFTLEKGRLGQEYLFTEDVCLVPGGGFTGVGSEAYQTLSRSTAAAVVTGSNNTVMVDSHDLSAATSDALHDITGTLLGVQDSVGGGRVAIDFRVWVSYVHGTGWSKVGTEEKVVKVNTSSHSVDLTTTIGTGVLAVNAVTPSGVTYKWTVDWNLAHLRRNA